MRGEPVLFTRSLVPDMNTELSRMAKAAPAQDGSRGIRFVAAGVLTLAANALWLRAEVVDAVDSVSYADWAGDVQAGRYMRVF